MNQSTTRTDCDCNFITFSVNKYTSNLYIDKTVQRTAISPAVVFLRTFCFSLNLTGMLNLTKIVHLPLVKNGKIGNPSCLIGNLNILEYMNMLLKDIC